MGHEHDGSGCLDCTECQATPMNTYPCTCPRGMRGEIESRNHVVEIDQVPLMMPSGKSIGAETFGQMTVRKTGRDVTVQIRIDEKWTDLISNGDFVVGYYPMPGFRIRPNYPTDESHIVRSEN